MLSAAILSLAAEARARAEDLPSWISLADPQAVSRAYPIAAAGLGIEGEATVQCLTSAGGVPISCKVMKETPPGLGFGAAALEAIQFYRFPAQPSDGHVIRGSAIQVPIRFEAPADLIARSRGYVAPSRPGAHRDLARAVVSRYRFADWRSRSLEAAMRGVPVMAPAGEEPLRWAESRRAISEAVEAGLPAVQEALALEIAAKTPAAVLTRMLNPSPPADVQAVARRLVEGASFPSAQPYVLAEIAKMRDDARARFCRDRAC